MAKSATETIQDHLMKRLEGELEADIKENFSPDVIILSTYGVFKGHDGVRQSAAKLDEHIGDAEFAYNHTKIEGKYGLLEWTAKSDEIIVRDGADSFVVENGKIVMQSIHYRVEENK